MICSLVAIQPDGAGRLSGLGNCLDKKMYT